jgi:uncharacterized protein with PQ loop repeat
MTPAEMALALFALCNSVRVFAYVPQIIAVARDTRGASAISYATWGLFAISHLSTVAYAIVVVNDWRMAAVFVANTICCLVIVGLTAWKRALFKAAQQLLASSKPPVFQKAQDQGQSTNGVVQKKPYRLLAGGKDVAF